MSKRILLICYSFPPHPGIGGRRWAKFSKFLSMDGFAIDVFNAHNFSIQTSLWNNEVENSRSVKVYSEKFFLQKLLLQPTGVLQKLCRKALIKIIKLTQYNESIITSFPNHKFWLKVQKSLDENEYKGLIVTGDPFFFYYASLLKRKTNCELILDYRDLWNDHSFYRKNVSLTGKQRSFFEKAENYAVNNCDKIIFVDQYLSNVVSKRINNKKVKLSVIHNGFDNDDFRELSYNQVNDKIKIFFAGNISSDLNTIVEQFLNSYIEYYNSGNRNFELYFYGKYDVKLVNKILLMAELGVTYHDILPYKEYLNKLNNSDVGIVILSEEYANSYTTKFSDYIALNKFILCLGFRGEFSDYIESKKIGLRFDPNEGIKFFDNLVNEFKIRSKLSLSDKSRFELSNVTKELISFIEY